MTHICHALSARSGLSSIRAVPPCLSSPLPVSRRGTGVGLPSWLRCVSPDEAQEVFRASALVAAAGDRGRRRQTQASLCAPALFLQCSSRNMSTARARR